MEDNDRATQNTERILASLLNGLGPDLPSETPGRIVRAWKELLSGYKEEPLNYIKTFSHAQTSGLVTVGPLPYTSVCEHHLLPFTGHAWIGYVPNAHVLGLSKFPRILNAYARRWQLQERLTNQVADCIYHSDLNPQGVIVITRGVHTCMWLRGAKSKGEMSHMAYRGIFLNAEPRNEFLNLISLKGGIIA